jgi:hypothetical protein
MSNKHLYWLAGVLTAVALFIFAYKLFVLNFPLSPDRLATAWQIEARIDFTAKNQPVTARLMLPKSTSTLPIFNESFVSGGYGLTTRDIDDNRMAVFSIARATGLQALFYRATTEIVGKEAAPQPSPVPKIVRKPLSDIDLAATKSLLDELRPRAADTASLISLLMNRLQKVQAGDAADLLLGERRNSWRIADTAISILRAGGIPARRVNGFPLIEDRRRAPVNHWIEAYIEDRWQPFDLKNGSPGAPANNVAWWRGKQGPLELTGGADHRVTFSVSKAHQFALRLALVRGRAVGAELVEFSLFGLPFQAQQVYRILLVMPVGIVLLVLLRNIIGIRTFGTFMPVLIAMAFRETNLIWGIALFALIVFCGMSVRFYLEHLKLLLVPRLAAVVIVVIGVMALLSTLSFKLGIVQGLSIALFPIVILTMTIERMTVVWDERGPKESLIQATGSLFVAILCFLVMSNKVVEHLTFVFPELLLLTLAMMLLLGRYSGYRLLELTRFKVLSDKAAP